MNYSAQPMHTENLNDTATAAIIRALWPSNNRPCSERLIRRPSDRGQRHDPSPVVGNVSNDAYRCPVFEYVTGPLAFTPSKKSKGKTKVFPSKMPSVGKSMR
ncbi:hypothetical protein AVEN_211145-1 [Araneus ventricosus]|uniref:Uncharacterized protein n=1 Tax=Araneus ventricosus TaxID=182803 RepID=A0A4Y2G403_ARAVE|nr:hypothetical protein AVEN_211145-1 [Araneus ventricosus]